MADRMDSSHGSPVNGLSIWVGLAALFSSSSDRKRAHEVLTKAKADIETQREGSRATSGMRRDGDKTERGTDKGTGGATRAVRRMSKALRLRKKPPDTALKKEGVEQEV
jgi:hypothetical protein